MIDIKFSVLDTNYHLTTDERQYILNRVVPSKAKNAVNGFSETDQKYFRSLENVWSYIERVAPIQTSKVLSCLRDIEAVQHATKEAVEALCVEESE